MLRILFILSVLLSVSQSLYAQSPVHLWYEPEWFKGVKGSFAYWTGTAKPHGAWGIAGPGISAEWTQGGESEWNSIGVAASESRAECYRDIVIPRAGEYQLWIRHVDHRRKKAPFRLLIQKEKTVLVQKEFGTKSVVPINDEYMLYWGFSFGWASLKTKLPEGKLRLSLRVDRAGEAWRQVDAIFLTTDLAFHPYGREKPPFGYIDGMKISSKEGTKWRGEGKISPMWKNPRWGGRDFSLLTGVEGSATWWKNQQPQKLSLLDLFYQHCPPPDIRKVFHKQYPTPQTTPLINSPYLLPGFYLGSSPDLSDTSPLRKWLIQTKTPFYILTNYASPRYDEKTGPATYAALEGLPADQFLGYIHGEAPGSVGVNWPSAPLGKTRAEHLRELGKYLKDTQQKEWSRFYRTNVKTEHRSRSIPCLSVESTALAHFFHQTGSRVVGYELDATNVHAPMRIAFQRGAARQFGGTWINYASGNFGDACNYFTQEPRVPRGAKGWWHSKYAVTDGVTAGWYRKMYYLNYLSGAGAIFWEQGLENQWILPGPGTHPVELSPFGRATEDFQSFLSRIKDRGEPITPIAFMLNQAHGYEPVNYHGKMLHFFEESPGDIELRELFNVAWYPSGILEGRPAAPDVQSMPSGVYGNSFDVLVDTSERSSVIHQYPVLWLTGDVDLSGTWPKTLQQYVEKGGTLVVNISNAKALSSTFLGLLPTGKKSTCSEWTPSGGKPLSCTPYEVVHIERKGTTALAWATKEEPLVTRHTVGKGAVITILVPRVVGLDERAHPSLGYIMNGLTEGLLPVAVRRGDNTRLQGEIMYQMNKTKNGVLVTLINNRGVDKTQHGVARVDRRKFVDVLLRTKLPVKQAQEMTTGTTVKTQQENKETVIPLRVHPGDIQVIQLTTQ